MSDDKPKIELEGNTFERVGTAIKGLSNVSAKDNTFKDVGTVIDSNNSESPKNNVDSSTASHKKERAWNIAYVVIGGLILAAIIGVIRHFNVLALFGF